MRPPKTESFWSEEPQSFRKHSQGLGGWRCWSYQLGTAFRGSWIGQGDPLSLSSLLHFIHHQNIISWHTNDNTSCRPIRNHSRRSLRNLSSCLKRRRSKWNSSAGLDMPRKKRWGMISNSPSPFLCNQKTKELLIPMIPPFVLDTTD